MPEDLNLHYTPVRENLCRHVANSLLYSNRGTLRRLWFSEVPQRASRRVRIIAKSDY